MKLKYIQSLTMLALLATGAALPAEGVTITNQSTAAVRIARTAAGQGTYFAYLQEGAVPGAALTGPVDWMEIDWETTAAGRDILVGPGQTCKIDLVGNGAINESFRIWDGAVRHQASFVVSRPELAPGTSASSRIWCRRTANVAAGRGRLDFQLAAGNQSLVILDEAPAPAPEPPAPDLPAPADPAA